VTLRHTAWAILRSGADQPLREVDRAAHLEGFDDRDRGLLRAIVGTEIRRRGTLRAIVSHFTHGTPKPDLAAHLRVGLTQMLFLDRVPPHAAISETVSAASDTLGLSKGRLVNGVLREVQRQVHLGLSGNPRCDVSDRNWHFERPVFRDPTEHPALWAEDVLNIPGHLFKRWSTRHGETKAQELARWFLTEPPLCLWSSKDSAPEADSLGIDNAAHSSMSQCLLVPSNQVSSVLNSKPFQDGEIWVQGETAQRAGALMNSSGQERILDICAAPGTKAMQMARSGASVLACDQSAKRLALMIPEMARQGDGFPIQLLACNGGAGIAAGELFDGVMVDAPCSNTGVLGARPAARWRFGPANLRALTSLQRNLLDLASKRVAVGGRLLWSVCSIEPEEGLQQIRGFLQDNPEFELDDSFLALPSSEGPVDGGFAARLIKAGG